MAVSTISARPMVMAPLRRVSRHRPFAIVLTVAAALRIVTMVAIRPGEIYYGDSYAYLATAVHPGPSWGFQPSGYPLLLWLLLPFHSLTLVVALQHVMGLAMGAMSYALLRKRFRLPGWGATLAVLPVLFDAYLLQLEHGVLTDTLFIFLIVSAVTVALWRPVPGPWALAGAGLLMAMAALTRTIGLPFLLLFILYVVVRRVNRRRQVIGVAALLVAAGLPLSAYATWYHSRYHVFQISGGEGITLWARTMTFADCKVIKPKGKEAALCPRGAHHDASSEYVWATDSPINTLPGGFGNNDLARSFALDAIKAQPLGYAKAVLADVSLAFHWERVPHPARVLGAYEFRSAPGRLSRLPAGWGSADQVVRAYDPDVRSVRGSQPYLDFLQGYQDIVSVPGPLLGLILLAGAAGLRRREVLLTWTTAVALLVLPVAALDFDHRYLLPVLPVASLAAAIAIADLLGRRKSAEHTDGTGQDPETFTLESRPPAAVTSWPRSPGRTPQAASAVATSRPARSEQHSRY